MQIIKSKVAVLKKKNSIEILDINLKKPGPKQVLVKIYYAGICASQYMEYRSLRGKDKWLPHMFGHEGVGIIKMIGKKVSGLKVGNKVILSWIKNNNTRDVSGSILHNKKKINYGSVTTFGNYSLISSNRIYRLPKNIEFKSAALYGCAIPTGMGVVINEAKPKKKDICSVVGLGGVGIFSLIALKAIGIKKIIGIDNNSKRLNFLKKLGFKNLININDKNYISKINNITLGKKFDYVFESTGNSKSIENAFELLNNKSGKLYFSSHPKKGQKISINPHDLISGKKIFGSWGGGSNLNKDILKFNNLILKSKINLKKLYKIYTFKTLYKLLDNFSKLSTPRTIVKMKH